MRDYLRALGPGADGKISKTEKHLPGNWEGTPWHHVCSEFLDGRSGSLCQSLPRDPARTGPGEPHEATRMAVVDRANRAAGAALEGG